MKTCIRNKSSQSVYIQSASQNLSEGKEQGYIKKLRAGYSTTVFSFKFFAEQLQNAVKQGNDVDHFVFSNIPLGVFEDVSRVKNLCTFRVSFVKGWGPGYIRPEITLR